MKNAFHPRTVSHKKPLIWSSDGMILGNRSTTLESATQQVTDALVKLTQCLRVCRTLLWASQVPLQRYPPRLSDSG